MTLLNAWILLGLGLAFVARSVGRWTLRLRALDLAVSLFGVFVLYVLVDRQLPSTHPTASPVSAPLAHILGQILPYLPVFALIGVGMDLWKIARRYVRRVESRTLAA